MILALVILLAVLLLFEWGYIAMAGRCRVGVTHTEGGREVFTAVGGGWVVVLAAIASVFIIPQSDSAYLWMVGGGVLLGIVSYLDDVMRLSAGLRLFVQLIVVAFVLSGLALSGHVWLFVIGMVFVTGYVNASNFMDGSNGMLATYSIIVLLTLWAVTQTPWQPVALPHGLPAAADVEGLTACLMVAAVVLYIFNSRALARVFAGDVGSISMGYFIGIAVLALGVVYGRLSIFVVVLVFIVDTFVTFVERVLAREPVMKPHHRHLYQRLIAAGYRPTVVASWYALAQALVSGVWLVLPPVAQNIYAVIVAIVVTGAYIVIKKRVNRKLSCS